MTHVVWCGVVYAQTCQRILLASFVGYTTLLLQTAFYCETSLRTYQDACQHFSVDSRLLSYCCEKLKSHTKTFLAETSCVTEELMSSCVVCSSFFLPFPEVLPSNLWRDICYPYLNYLLSFFFSHCLSLTFWRHIYFLILAHPVYST